MYLEDRLEPTTDGGRLDEKRLRREKLVFYRNFSFFDFTGLGYPIDRVPIFKILRKDCIFERFGITRKNSENLSF